MTSESQLLPGEAILYAIRPHGRLVAYTPRRRTELLRRAQQTRNVAWHAPTNDPRTLYRHAKLVLVPSMWDGEGGCERSAYARHAATDMRWLSTRAIFRQPSIPRNLQ